MGVNYSPAIVTDNLILCLDAANRDSYSGSGTTWINLVSSRGSGSLTNGPTFNSQNAGSIVFNGTNNYVTCGPVYTFGLATSVATILFWAKGSGNPFSNQRTTAGNHGWVQTAITSNQFNVYIDAYDALPYGEFFILPLSATPYPSLSGQWNFYSIRINRPIHQYSIGVNNYFQNYTRNFTVASSFDFSTIEIGRINNYSYFTTYFTGNIAYVQVYVNRYLTDAEILQNYNATRGRFDV